MYVDAYYNRQKDEILVSERRDGQRILKSFPAEHVFYYSHPAGSHQSIYGDSCKKFSTNDNRKFRKELARITAPVANKKPIKIFESDVNPVFRSLASHYRGADTPTLNVGFFDIETDFSAERGFAPVTDPFNPITAISVYRSQDNKLVSLILCPPTVDYDDGLKICEQFEDTYLFNDEKELLRSFLEVIEDTDCLSGWNSSLYDIPYVVNRMVRVLGKDATRELCLWGQYPREKKVKQFKREHQTYDLVGRVHLDYLDLYKKHNPQQLHSYRLDFVGEVEIGENKTVYEGTLDDLYKKDLKKFIEYNRQDTLLLYKIDAKKKFIELANQIAHGNCVQLKTTMGTVSLVDQAITNEINAMGLVAPDRKREIIESEASEDDEDDDEEEDRTPVVGAYVADPKKGMHEHVGCIDINSLYPSAIRALNMSPETIIGQIRLDETMALIAERVKLLGPKRRAEAWEGIFAVLEVDHMHARDGAPITIDFEDGTTKVMSGRDLYNYVYNPNNHVCVSANGTLFRTDKDGIIPKLLAKWYAERKDMQSKAEWYNTISSGIEIDSNLANAINNI